MAADHPEPAKTCFIMMRFDGALDREIVRAIIDGFSSHGITAIRADEREYHPDLFSQAISNQLFQSAGGRTRTDTAF
ncbi:MAG: hypothetical protein U1G07_01915 [Verrucomicrobiota bacterium]